MASIIAQDVKVEERKPFVVGIGACAGGLEALESFFDAMSCDSGFAFVVVQHLSPDFKSHMDELLSRRTKMPVQQAADGASLAGNNVYLMPADVEMLIADGRILLSSKIGKSGERHLLHPIDQVLRSMAGDCRENCAAIILSGTGNDGSRGVVAVHEAGGLVLAQDGDSATFNSMPQNAVATEAVDHSLPPDQMPEVLLKFANRDGTGALVINHKVKSAPIEGLDRIFQLLRSQFGIDFSHYKGGTVGRRIERRIDYHKLKNLEQYLEYIDNDKSEINELYKDLLIGVTKFFRDRDAFKIIGSKIIPALFERPNSPDQIRIWVAGCATGEEAYSYAMMIDEEKRRNKSETDVKIFSTDAHRGSLEAASRGVYSEAAMEELTAEQREHYFIKEHDGFHITRDLRQYVVFAPHNLLNDAPFTQLDLVSCRNLLIYLQPFAQGKALSLFHFALRPNGFLVLGPSEFPGDLNDEFKPIDNRWKIYQKKRDVRLPIETRLNLPSTVAGLPRARPKSQRAPIVEPRIDRTLLNVYDAILDRKMPSSILVNDKYEIVHVFGGAERFLTVRAGRPTNNVFDAVDAQLHSSLVTALDQSSRLSQSIAASGIPMRDAHGDFFVRLHIDVIKNSQITDTHYLIEIFSSPVERSQPDQPSDELKIEGHQDPNQPNIETNVSGLLSDNVDLSPKIREHAFGLEAELRHSQDTLQATVEQMESSNEELQAANEELLSSNEELQSTNEELHSVNEELFTVNAEHQRRVEELAEANDDMENLLATTRVGVIFLDRELYIRRYTPEIARLLHLVPQDIGRSFDGFSHYLRHENLLEILRDVIASHRERELEIYDRHDSPLLLRALPYRSGRQVEGVVLTLVDIRAIKATQTDLERFKYLTEAALDAIVMLRRNGHIDYVNPAATTILGFEREEFLKLTISDLHNDINIAEFRSEFRSPLERQMTYEAQWTRKDGTSIPVDINSSLVDFAGERYLCLFVRDLSDRKSLVGRLERMGQLVEASSDAILLWNDRDGILTWNRGATLLYGYTQGEAVGLQPRELLRSSSDDNWSDIQNALQATGEWSGTLTHTTKESRQIHVSTRMQIVRDSKHSRNILEINRDITAQHQAQAELERANLAAELASRSKTEFLTNMSHELRTPMTAMLGFADILRRESDDPEFIERVETIRRNGEYLLALINDILDLSKIEAGKVEVESERVNIVNVVDDVRSLMNVRALAEGIPLNFKFSTKVPRSITGDRIRIRQILVNLIGNALKFTDEGEVRVVIGMSSSSSDLARLNIDVIDTGIGISAESVERLFKPFSQVARDTNRKYGGSGLGLSISKRLAEKMMADIVVESTPGEGSRFRLSLVVTSREAQDLIDVSISEDRPSQDKPAQSQELFGIEARILLADDRRDVWRVAKYYLEKAGATVNIAEDGRQAVDTAIAARDRGMPFDLILMDMQMPVMDGRDAVKELRRIGFVTPIIALTADAMEGERDACLSIGCNEYQPKPINGPELLRMISELITTPTAMESSESTAHD